MWSPREFALLKYLYLNGSLIPRLPEPGIFSLMSNFEDRKVVEWMGFAWGNNINIHSGSLSVGGCRGLRRAAP